jgi:hypothetical protein
MVVLVALVVILLLLEVVFLVGRFFIVVLVVVKLVRTTPLLVIVVDFGLLALTTFASEMPAVVSLFMILVFGIVSELSVELSVKLIFKLTVLILFLLRLLQVNHLDPLVSSLLCIELAHATMLHVESVELDDVETVSW